MVRSHNHFPFTMYSLCKLFESHKIAIFASSIPSSIGNLTKVTQIFLRSNYFTSQIPSLSKLKDLNLIDLRFNNLRRRIPEFLTNLTRFTKVYLSFNQLTSQIGEFQSSNFLQILRLENNRLYGSIPKSISNLVNLIELHISSNDLSGIVEFDQSTKLKELQKQSIIEHQKKI